MDIRNTHAKYKRPIAYSKKLMVDNVEYYVKGHGKGHTLNIYHAGHTRKASRISKAAVDNFGKGVGNFYLS